MFAHFHPPPPAFSPNEPLLQTKSYVEPKGVTHKSGIVVVTVAMGASWVAFTVTPETPGLQKTV